MPGLRQPLIRKYFKPGSVWKAVETFQGQPPRIKLLLIIRIEQSYVFYLLPTSKGEYFRRVKGVSFVHCPVGTCDCFLLETYIGCDSIRSQSMAQLLRLFENKKIEYVGEIPANLLAEIEEALKKSRVLSPQEKARLFPK